MLRVSCHSPSPYVALGATPSPPRLSVLSFLWPCLPSPLTRGFGHGAHESPSPPPFRSFCFPCLSLSYSPIIPDFRRRSLFRKSHAPRGVWHSVPCSQLFSHLTEIAPPPPRRRSQVFSFFDTLPPPPGPPPSPLPVVCSLSPTKHRCLADLTLFPERRLVIAHFSLFPPLRLMICAYLPRAIAPFECVALPFSRQISPSLG